MKLIKFIPNLFTLGNLCLGVLGIQILLNGDQSQLRDVALLIFIAAGLDFFDGFSAKQLKAQSAIGAQLDSLADLITFGLLPGFIYRELLAGSDLQLLYLLVPVCSAWRLAKFNTSTDQKDSFKGISTTAHGLFVATLLIISSAPKTMFDEVFGKEITILTLVVFFSILMISNLRMISLKFSDFSINGNWDRYLMIFATITLVIVLGWSAAPFAMLLYLVLSSYKHYTSN